jgi:hypothetical protein
MNCAYIFGKSISKCHHFGALRSAITLHFVKNQDYWIVFPGKSADREIGVCNEPHCLQCAKCL